MNKTFPLLCWVGLSLMAGGQGADAAIANGAAHFIVGDANSASSGELFLNVWDEAAALSYSLDLGVTVEEFLADPSGRTWNLDQRFKDFAAAGHPLRYNIAANNTYGGIPAAALGAVPSTYGVASSVLNHPTAIALAEARTGGAGTGLQQLSSPIQARASHLNLNAAAQNGLTPGEFGAMTDFAADLSEATDGNTDAYGAYFPNLWGTNLSDRFAFSTTATVRDGGAQDQKLRLYFFGLQGPGVNKVKATDLGGGLVMFALDAANATLAWSKGGRQVDHPPVAVPGAWQKVNAGAAVTLDGSGSYDPDPGDALSYAWSQASGTPVALNGADTAKPDFVAGQAGDSYIFTLTVTDSHGKSAARRTRVIVPNHRPVANISAPVSVASGTPVSLDGSGSFDPDIGDTLAAYAWVQQSGPVAGLGGAGSAVASFTAGAAGSVYRFTLMVTDNHGLSSPAKLIKITVH